MPHANLQSHFARQASGDPQLLSWPAVNEVMAKLRELGQKNGEVPLPALAQLVSANYRHLQTLMSQRELVQVRPRTPIVTLDSAISIVPQFLPRILGWVSASKLGADVGIHRNSVVSIIDLYGKPEMVRMCRDNCLYVSPEGEALVRSRKHAHEQIAHLEGLSEFAKRVGKPVNYITAFFSKHSVKYATDIHGRARLTEEQKKLYLDSLARLQQRRGRVDIVLDGNVFRSCLRVAAEQASLFTRPGRELHRALSARLEHSVRHFADRSGTSRKTPLGVYIPAEIATNIVSAISLSDAALILGLPKERVSAWRKKYAEMRPPTTPLSRQRGIYLPGLAEVAHRKFLDDPNLSQLPTVPTIISSLMIHQVASKLGTSFSKIVESLPVTAEDRERLEDRVGALPRATHRTITSILRRDPTLKSLVPLTNEGLEALCRNAEPLGLSRIEFLELALSPGIAAKCIPDQMPLRITSQRFRALFELGLIDSMRFNLSSIIAADTVAQLLSRWSNSQKVHLSTVKESLDLSNDDSRKIGQGRGEIPGQTVRKVLSLVRLSGDLARKLHPHIFTNGPRYQEPGERASTLTSWDKRMLQAPVITSLPELSALLAEPDSKGKELVNLCISPRLLSVLIANVARARNVKPQEVYLFTRETLIPHSSWPATYAEFSRVVAQERSPLRFALVAGKFLVTLSDAHRRVYALGTSRNLPREGDIFTHPNMHDYGLVKRIVQDDGGTKALVDLVLEERSLIFRV